MRPSHSDVKSTACHQLRPAWFSRALTPGEAALAQEVLGPDFEVEPIRLVTAPRPLTRAFVPGRWLGRDWIVWPRSLPHDFTAGDIPLKLQAVLVHELVHVWQARQGINLALAKLKAGDGPKAYGLPPGPIRFEALNIEQQAVAVERAFVHARLGATAKPLSFDPRGLPFPIGTA